MAETNNQQAKSSRTLVITRTTFFDIDKIVAAIVLGKILTRYTHNQVDLYFGEKIPLGPLNNIVAPQDVNFREKLNPDFFTVSIHRGTAKIKEVKWEEAGEDLKLIIYTDEGQINPDDYQLASGIPKYDQVYTLGIKTKEEALNALGEYSGIWQTSHSNNLDIRSENQRYAENNYIYADSRSFAECVFKFAKENEIEVSNSEATELLSCIYWKTNSLRNKYTTFDTLGTVQQLIQNGGSVSDAVSHIFSTISVVEVRARQEIYKSMRLTSEKIAFAQVTAETARQLSKIQPLNPEKNPLFELKDADTSFVMIPLSDNKTLVLCSSRDEKINIKRLFSNYNYVGDPFQAELMFNMNVQDAEKEIKRILLKVFPQANGNKEQQKPQREQQTQMAQTQREQPVQQTQPIREQNVQPAREQSVPPTRTPAPQPVRDEKPAFVVTERKPTQPRPVQQFAASEPAVVAPEFAAPAVIHSTPTTISAPAKPEPTYSAPAPMAQPEAFNAPAPIYQEQPVPVSEPVQEEVLSEENEYEEEESYAEQQMPMGFVSQIFPDIQPPMPLINPQQNIAPDTAPASDENMQTTPFASVNDPMPMENNDAENMMEDDSEQQDMVMVEVPPSMGDLGPADPLPSAN